MNQTNHENEHYLSLRARANEHGDMMAQCFQQSHEAYTRRNGALAKDLSNQGKEYQRKMEELNKQASDWIFIGAQPSPSSSQIYIPIEINLFNRE